MYCKNCQKILNLEEKFCSNCGEKVDIQSKQGDLNTKKQSSNVSVKKQKKKWLLIILIIPIVYFLIYGAIVLSDLMVAFSDYMGINDGYNIDEMVNYMNEKYTDDTFTYKNITGGHLGSNVKKILVESQKYQGRPIRVICTEVDGTYKYADNYLAIKYENDTRKFLKTSLDKVFGNNFYLDYVADDSAWNENGSSDMSFNEYIDSSPYIFFSAVVSYNVTDGTEEIVFNKIKEAFSDMSFVVAYIYFVDENVDASGLDKEEKSYLIKEKKYNKHLHFKKEDIDTYSNIKWSNSND